MMIPAWQKTCEKVLFHLFFFFAFGLAKKLIHAEGKCGTCYFGRTDVNKRPLEEIDFFFVFDWESYVWT